MEKKGKEISKKKKKVQCIGSYFFLLVILATMLIYQTIILGTKGKKDEDGNTIEEQTTF
jgi:hypothetical protein